MTSFVQREPLTHSVQGRLPSCSAFLDQGAFGRVARSGLNAIKDRQYTTGDLSVSGELQRALDAVLAILRLRLSGLWPSGSKPACGLKRRSPRRLPCWFKVGSGAFLLLTPRKQRLGAVVVIDDTVFDLCGSQDIKIAQFELLMVFQSLITFLAAVSCQLCLCPFAFGTSISAFAHAFSNT